MRWNRLFGRKQRDESGLESEQSSMPVNPPVLAGQLWGRDHSLLIPRTSGSIDAPRLTLTGVGDLKRAGLVDWRRMHPFWQSVAERTHFAVAQRYPLGYLSHTRLLDVERIENLGNTPFDSGAQRYLLAATLPNKAHPDYIAFSRMYLSDQAPFRTIYGAFIGGATAAFHPPTDRPDIVHVLHEVLHPPLQIVLSIPQIRDELFDALGVQKANPLGTAVDVVQKLETEISLYATLNPTEAIVEAWSEGIALGSRARPMAKQITGILDKWVRFDSPAAPHIASMVEQQRSLAFGGMVATASSFGQDFELPAAVVEEVQARPVPRWRPLDLSGRVTGEGSVDIIDHREFFGLDPSETATAPDRHFDAAAAILATHGGAISWSASNADAAFEVTPELEDPSVMQALQTLPRLHFATHRRFRTKRSGWSLRCRSRWGCSRPPFRRSRSPWRNHLSGCSCDELGRNGP